MPHQTPRRAPRNRRVGRGAALLAAGALTAVLVPSLGTSSVAAPASHDSGAASLLAATPDAPPTGRAWIEGVVVNQAARPLDGILVEAYNAFELKSDPLADPVASWVTYEDPADGPEHGFFRLYVPRGQDAMYQLKFSSPEGTADPYKTRGLDYENIWVGGTRKGPGKLVALDEDVVMSLVRKAEADIAISTDRKTTKPTEKGRLSVKVTSPDVDPVTGRVSITIDKRSKGSRVVAPGSHGRTAFTLPRLKPGKHTIVVRYAGSQDVKAATEATTVKVDQLKKKKHKGKHKGKGKGGKGKR